MFILKDSIHFDTLRNQIKFQQTPWDSLVRKGEINESELTVLKNLFQKGFQAESQSEKDLDVVFKIIKTTDNNTVLQNCYSLLVDLFINESNKSIYEIFKQSSTTQKYLDILIGSFQKISNNTELSSTVKILGLYSVVVLFLESPSKSNDTYFESFINGIYFPLLKQTTDLSESKYALIRYLQELCTVPSYRLIIFSKDYEFVEGLFDIILQPINASTNNSSSATTPTNSQTKLQFLPNNNLSIQLQYYSLLTIWLLTFENSIALKLSNKYSSLLFKLLTLISVTIKEKITRLSVSILLNCCNNNKIFLKKLVLLNNSKTLLSNLSNRKFSDVELTQDLSTLNDSVKIATDELNSFDEYLIELDSKQLCWSPPHVDNQFWYDNVDKFRENNWKLLKNLCDLITEFNKYSDSSDLNNKSSLILQVVLNDLTRIIEMLPESVEYIEKFGAKIKVMELLNYPDSKVKYEALKTTQALVKLSFK